MPDIFVDIMNNITQKYYITLFLSTKIIHPLDFGKSFPKVLVQADKMSTTTTFLQFSRATITLVSFRDRGGIGLFITPVPKVYNNVFLFDGLPTLGTSVNFDWLIHKVEFSDVPTFNSNF